MDRANLTTRLAEMGYASSEEYLESLARGHELRLQTEVCEMHYGVTATTIEHDLSYVRDGQTHVHRIICPNLN